MKAFSNSRPPLIQQLGANLYAYNHDIQESEEGFDYNPLYFDHSPSRGEVINDLVTTAYPHGEENALQRKGILNPQDQEFLSYYNNVEEIKLKVTAEYGELG
jgi:hypothetical protein